jgi:hypothetical protein
MNKFKENSRFASLVDDSSNKNKSVFGKKTDKKSGRDDNRRDDNRRDDNRRDDNRRVQENPVIEEEPKVDSSSSINHFKSERPTFQRDNYRRPYGRDKEFMEMLQKQEEQKKVEEEKRKDEERKVALAIESFPELVKNKAPTAPLIIENTTNFIEKLKTNVKVVAPVKNIIPPGWTTFKRDMKTNETIIEIGELKNAKEYIKTPEDLAYDIVDNLVYLHEKRTAEYIENWGEDEWEKMFRFQNYDYDYHYFDKLDEIYAKNNPDSEDEYSEEEEY